jgi:pre-60S factor REI1
MDKGHCKMAYDDTEDPEALLKYYDFGPDTSDTEAPSETKNGELQLLSGTRLGNRHFLKSYKRQHHRSTAEEQQQQRVDDQGADDQGASGPDPSLVVSRQQVHPESLAKNRKERRHPHLAITDGQAEQQKNMTLGGIHEAALKHAYQSSVGVKQNAINTFRFRTQNPI